jgi:hypothetical protein
MGRGAIFIVAAVSVIALGCSRALSRSQAADLIQKGDVMPKVFEVPLPLGEHCDDNDHADLLLKENEGELFLERKLRGIAAELRQRRLLVAQIKHLEGSMVANLLNHPRPTGACRDAGLSATGYWNWTLAVSDEGRMFGITGPRLQLATSTFSAVTGLVRDQGADRMTAEYTYRWSLTPLGQKLPTVAPPQEPQKATAAFRLYDDGWRLAK